MNPVLSPETTRPGNPRPVDTRPPARPTGSPPPSGPRPSPSRPGRIFTFRTAAALIVVGLGILVFHYFAPVLLLAALPTREWRAAAGVPVSSRRHRLLRFARAHGPVPFEGCGAGPSTSPTAVLAARGRGGW